MWRSQEAFKHSEDSKRKRERHRVGARKSIWSITLTFDKVRNTPDDKVTLHILQEKISFD